MADLYSGNCIVGLLETADSNLEIPRPEVEIGGKIVGVDGLKISIGPQAIESMRRIEAEKQAAIARGEPHTHGAWQTDDPKARDFIRAIAAAAGFPGIYD